MYPFCLSLIWVEEKTIDDIIPECYLLESNCFTFVFICAMFSTSVLHCVLWDVGKSVWLSWRWNNWWDYNCQRRPAPRLVRATLLCLYSSISYLCVWQWASACILCFVFVCCAPHAFGPYAHVSPFWWPWLIGDAEDECWTTAMRVSFYALHDEDDQDHDDDDQRNRFYDSGDHDSL